METESSGAVSSPTIVSQTNTIIGIVSEGENEVSGVPASTVCKRIKAESNSTEDFIQPISELVVFRLALAALVILINAIVVVAIIYNWKKMRQNIYIFALNISLCDFMIGLFNFGVSAHHLAVEAHANNTNDGTAVLH